MMIPIQIKHIEEKIDRLEKKLDIVVHYFVQMGQKENLINKEKTKSILNIIGLKNTTVAEK